jgi:hypothetical protein
MLVDLQELHDRIVNAVALVDFTFLYKMRDEWEYHLDVSHVTRASHTEHPLKKKPLKCFQV